MHIMTIDKKFLLEEIPKIKKLLRDSFLGNIAEYVPFSDMDINSGIVKRSLAYGKVHGIIKEVDSYDTAFRNQPDVHVYKLTEKGKELLKN